jgi:hypothetical protein
MEMEMHACFRRTFKDLNRNLTPVKEMDYICKKCGYKSFGHMLVPCPTCGGNEFVSSTFTTNYSGTVVVTGSTFSVYEVIINARNMFASEAQADKEKAKFIEPMIIQLDAAAEIIQKQGTALASTQKKDLEEYQKKIEEYRTLIDKSEEEKDFQNFFLENPVFLDPRVKTVIPKKSFGGDGFPDLLLILHDMSHILVEIENPSVKLFNIKGDPTSEFTHAQQQIRGYLQWAMEDKEFIRKRGCPNINVDNTKGLVVIGKSIDLGHRGHVKLENIVAEVRNRYEIKTFDRVLKENEAILGNLKKTK